LTFPEARAIAAYYEAGREAVLRGQRKGEVDPSKNPNDGYSNPTGPQSDSGQLSNLVRNLGILHWPQDKIQAAMDLGRADARQIIFRKWGKVRALGMALEASPNGIIHGSMIKTML
jgi:hypothetical protein